VVCDRTAHHPQAQVLARIPKGLDLVKGQPLGEFDAVDLAQQLANRLAQRER